mgnify:CR=1 FL=1
MSAECAFLLVFRRKKRFPLKLLLSLLGYLACVYLLYSVVIRIPGPWLAVRTFYYFTVFALTLAVACGCFELDHHELLFAGVGGYALQHMAFGVVRLSQYLIGYQYETGLGYFLYHWCFYFLLPALFYLIFLRRKFDRSTPQIQDVRLTWLALLILFVSVEISLLTRSGYAGEGNDFLDLCICSIYLIICSGMELFLLFYIPKEGQLRQESELMEQMIRRMDAHSAMSKKSVEIINRKCHDIKCQMRMLMATDDQRSREQYVQEISRALSIYEGTYNTGNAALDFVLCERSPIFQEDGIQFTCIVDGALLEFMQPLDVTALFGNALDNAIESVMKDPEPDDRLIGLRVSQQGEMVHIHVENHCPEEIRFERDIPVTNKLDKDYHGFGVKSICHIAEKYGGILSFRQERDKFMLDIVCPISQKTT